MPSLSLSLSHPGSLIPQAIAGEIGMDQVLDNIANSLFNGLLPAVWSKLAPATCKQLASWLDHLKVCGINQSSRSSHSSNLSSAESRAAVQVLVGLGRAAGHVAVRAAYTAELPDSPSAGE